MGIFDRFKAKPVSPDAGGVSNDVEPAAPLTHEQLATMFRRDAELDADPSLWITQDELMADLRANWS